MQVRKLCNFHNIFLTVVTEFIVTENHAGFIEVPSSINASLGSTSQFTCTVQGGLVQWHINGRDLSHISLARDISFTAIGKGGSWTSRLSILASAENNNSAVQCILNNGTNDVLFSPTVELKVQGTSKCMCEVIHIGVE